MCNRSSPPLSLLIASIVDFILEAVIVYGTVSKKVNAILTGLGIVKAMFLFLTINTNTLK